MTLLERNFLYGLPPGPRELRALDQVRNVYGIRRISFNEQMHSIRVEFDASRLSAADVAALLRDAGMQVSGPTPAA
jgi:hypothetical protein